MSALRFMLERKDAASMESGRATLAVAGIGESDLTDPQATTWGSARTPTLQQEDYTTVGSW